MRYSLIVPPLIVGNRNETRYFGVNVFKNNLSEFDGNEQGGRRTIPDRASPTLRKQLTLRLFHNRALISG